jgi:Holliday junction resolvase RusA-like endonuclease
MAEQRVLTIRGINPEPWTSPSMGRGRAYKNPVLRYYQEAIKETLEDAGLPEPTTELCEVEFYFWRNLELYDTGNGRARRRQRADATNLQKALEDCLQGILFANDRQVGYISSTIVEQEWDIEPAIVIVLSLGLRKTMPDSVRVAYPGVDPVSFFTVDADKRSHL